MNLSVIVSARQTYSSTPPRGVAAMEGNVMVSAQLRVIGIDRATLYFLAKDRVILTFRPGAQVPRPGEEFFFQAPSARYRLLAAAFAKPIAGRTIARFRSRLICGVLAANECEMCHGSEAIYVPGSACPECNGTGKLILERECIDCDGTGKIDFQECPGCWPEGGPG
jgi:hypothetical protein